MQASTAPRPLEGCPPPPVCANAPNDTADSKATQIIYFMACLRAAECSSIIMDTKPAKTNMTSASGHGQVQRLTRYMKCAMSITCGPARRKVENPQEIVKSAQVCSNPAPTAAFTAVATTTDEDAHRRIIPKSKAKDRLAEPAWPAQRGYLRLISPVTFNGRLGSSGAIRKSSICLPARSSATSQRGCLPRPDQVSEGSSGFRYFGITTG